MLTIAGTMCATGSANRKPGRSWHVRRAHCRAMLLGGWREDVRCSPLSCWPRERRFSSGHEALDVAADAPSTRSGSRAGDHRERDEPSLSTHTEAVKNVSTDQAHAPPSEHRRGSRPPRAHGPTTSGAAGVASVTGGWLCSEARQRARMPRAPSPVHDSVAMVLASANG